MSDNYLLMDTEVEKAFLIAKIMGNFKKHEEDFSAARKGFFMETQEQIEALQKDMEENPDSFKIPKSLIKLSRPKSHAKTYQRAIDMLTANVNDTIELTGDQYAAFVDDDWEWRKQWDVSNSDYIVKSRT